MQSHPRDHQRVQLLFSSDQTLVYRIVNEATQKLLILKALVNLHPSQTDLSRFFHEFEILKFLSGAGIDGIIPPIEKVVFESHHALLFEDRGGKALKQLAMQPLALDAFFKIALAYVETLGRIHAKGIVHKDINPSNLLATSDFSKTWIIDFSIASKTQREVQTLRPVKDLEGTLHYLPPEQSGRINRSLDYRADYYALGITFYELLTGKRPFHSDDVMELLHAHMTQDLPNISQIRSDVPLSLAKIISKMAAKDPDDRYQSASGLLADLRSAQALWEARDLTSTFALAGDDFSERFTIPEKIYGRESEIATLLEAYKAHQKASGEKQPGRLVLVAGRSGVGKSALVHQLFRPVALQGGYLLEGKIDQFQAGAILGGFKAGILKYFELLAGDSLTLLKTVVEEIKRDLRINVGVLTAIFADLAVYLGEHPAPQPLGPKESRDRLFEAILVLFQTMCRKKKLIFFIDDLQWADGITLDTVAMLTQWQIPGLMFMGAYRANEVDEAHPLALLMNAMGARATKLDVIPLPEGAVQEFLRDTLGNAPDLAKVAEVMIRKTGGNPFFTHQLLKKIYAEGMVERDATLRAWVADLEQISGLQVSDNVMEFLIGKFQALDQVTQDVLTVGAAFGATFGFGVVAGILKIDIDALVSGVQRAVDEEIIRPAGGNYQLFLSSRSWDKAGSEELSFKFLHDRLQQASYELKSLEERQKLHFALAELLVILPGHGPVEIADQYLKSDLRGIKPELAIRVSSQIVAAAAQAKKSSNYTRANAYIQSAEKICADEHLWKDYHDAMRTLYREATEISFLAGEKEANGQYGKTFLDRSITKLEQAEALIMLAKQAVSLVENEKSLTLALRGLALLGHKLSENPSFLRVIKETLTTLKMLKMVEKSPKRYATILDYAECKDPAVVLAQKGINVVRQSCFFLGKRNLFAIAGFANMQLLLRYGLTEISSAMLGSFLGMLNMLGKYQMMHELADVALKLINHPTSINQQLNTAGYFYVAIFNNHLQLPMIEVGQHYIKIMPLALDNREITSLNALAYYLSEGAEMHTLDRMDDLSSLESRLGQVASELQAWKNYWSGRHFFDAQREATPEQALSLSDKLEEIRESNRKRHEIAAELVTIACQLRLYVIFKKEDQALPLCQSFIKRQAQLRPMYTQIPGVFFAVIGLLGVRRRTRTYLSIKERWQVRSSIKFFKKLSAHNPGNFALFLHLLEAEYAYYKGKSRATLEALFSRATLTAEQSGNYLVSAFAHERAGEFHKATGNAQFAGFYLRKSHEVWAAWGATAKCRHLEDLYPEIFAKKEESASKTQSSTNAAKTSTEPGSTGLDFNQVLKAARSLSSEVVLSKLTQNLLRIVGEVSGAERGALLLPDKQGVFTVHSHFDHVATEANQSFTVPSRVITTVTTSRKPVIAVDAQSDEHLKEDRAIVERTVRSMACVPTISQGRISAILYLENNHLSGAFTAERMETLDILAAQAAVSIENALMYETLEEKVVEKTRDIHAMLQNLQQGVFTILEDFTIHPEYSTHLETILGIKHLAGRQALELLLNHASIGSNRLSEIQAALESSFGENLVTFEFNSHLLPTQLTRRRSEGDQYLELDWMPLVDSHDQIERIMITLRDVTELKRLQAEAQQKTMELAMIGEILDCGLGSLQAIDTQSKAVIAENRRLVDSARIEGGLAREALRQLFRNMHTLKGNARTLSLSFSVDAIHEAEQFLSTLQTAGAKTPSLVLSASDLSRLTEDLSRVETALAQYMSLANEKLSLKAESSSGSAMFSPDVMALLNNLKTKGAERMTAEELQVTAKRLSISLQFQPLTTLLAAELKSLPTLATATGKEPPQVEVESRVLFAVEQAQTLKDVFTHCLRNSIDHGVEPSDERKRAGKPGAGTIQISVRNTGEEVQLTIQDDGRGLNLPALKKKGLAGGLLAESASDAEIAEMIFQSGLSTASTVTDLSGRGVGMDAVRSLIKKSGGTIAVEFTGPCSANGCRPFQLVLGVPGAWVYRGYETVTLQAA